MTTAQQRRGEIPLLWTLNDGDRNEDLNGEHDIVFEAVNDEVSG